MTQAAQSDQLLVARIRRGEPEAWNELIARFGHHLALNWNLGLEDTIGANPMWGSLDFNFSGTYLLGYVVQGSAAGLGIDYAGTIGATSPIGGDTDSAYPTMKFQLTTTWAFLDRASISARVNYIDSMKSALDLVGWTGKNFDVGTVQDNAEEHLVIGGLRNGDNPLVVETKQVPVPEGAERSLEVNALILTGGVSMGQKETSLSIASSDLTTPRFDRESFATGTMSASAVKTFAEAGAHSLIVSTSSGRTGATMVRVGNSGVAQYFPQLASACEKPRGRQAGLRAN